MPRSRPLQIMITPRARQSARKYTLERPLPSSSPLAISDCHSPRALPFPWPHSPSSHNNSHRYLIVPNRYASRPRLGYTAKLATLRYVMMPDAVGRRTVGSTLKLLPRHRLFPFLVLLPRTTPKPMPFAPRRALAFLPTIFRFPASSTFCKLSRNSFPYQERNEKETVVVIRQEMYPLPKQLAIAST